MKLIFMKYQNRKIKIIYIQLTFVLSFLQRLI